MTNLAVATQTFTNPAGLTPGLPEVGVSLLRVFGALGLVLALFLGGVWLFRRWQRVAVHQGRAPKLQVLEAHGLGNRSALYVVGYERERLLVAASPTGVTLLSALPSAAESASAAPARSVSFAQALQQILGRS